MFLAEAATSGISEAWLSLILGPSGALVLSVYFGWERKKRIETLEAELKVERDKKDQTLIKSLQEKNDLLEKQRESATKVRETLMKFGDTLEAISTHMEISNGSMAQAVTDLQHLRIEWARSQGRLEGPGKETGPPGPRDGVNMSDPRG